MNEDERRAPAAAAAGGRLVRKPESGVLASSLVSASPIRENAAPPNSAKVSRMQRLLLLIALVAVAAFAYLHWFASPVPRYRLDEIGRQPVPRAEFFALWRETAYGLCDRGGAGTSQLGPADCRRYVDRAHERCAARAGAPAIVAGKAESRRWARPYLDCVLPVPVCRGVEVRTLEDALRHCPP